MIDEQQFIAAIQASGLQALLDQRPSQSASLKTAWRIPKQFRSVSYAWTQERLASLNLQVEGERVPPPIATWEAMQLPKDVVKVLRKLEMETPTAVQQIGVPVA